MAHIGPPAHDAHHAAVLILFYTATDNRWLIPFTMPPETMLAHAGQVSFPGGIVRPGETALRPAQQSWKKSWACRLGDRNAWLPVPLELLVLSVITW